MDVHAEMRGLTGRRKMRGAKIPAYLLVSSPTGPASVLNRDGTDGTGGVRHLGGLFGGMERATRPLLVPSRLSIRYRFTLILEQHLGSA